ncbi:hypothetical protein [Pseudomonas umsongensis]|uniref:hypothetical protein n=1 Tax=Pseudomonas umsongensis TaxID=198618 RepID=UPI001783F6A7|nr:hypothetical protein [Pseudomonas umsongensis]
MFRTKIEDIEGVPGMFGEGLAHWHGISRALNIHWYHVCVKERLDGRFVSMIEFLNDETRLLEVLESQSEDYVITEIQGFIPPWMTGSKSWRLEILNGVSIGYDRNGAVVCLLEVEGGKIYADTHDRSFDPELLTNVRKIY